MKTNTASICKTQYGIGTGIYIPDEMVKGIDPNQLTSILTYALSSVYSAIMKDEQEQMMKMIETGICPTCGHNLLNGEHLAEDELPEDYDSDDAYEEDDRDYAEDYDDLDINCDDSDFYNY